MGEDDLDPRHAAVMKILENEARRYELALLSYEGSFNPDDKSPYDRQPFTLLPEWQQEWHYRVADLVLAHGYKKIG